ncbi:sigma-54-dependent Fis family transcriptional regulator [bacterium]|nr:sigma-54-dependent Fis family transcriptional regulator [candidate division CSSED10-310 bacterium]
MSKRFLDVYFIGTEENLKKLKGFLPSIRELRINHISPDRIGSFLPQTGPARNLILWPDSASIRIMNRLARENAEVVLKHDIICAGTGIQVSDAFMLGRLGIDNLVDISRDGADLTTRITDWYDRWRSLKAPAGSPGCLEDIIIGNSDAIRRLRELIMKVAEKDRLTVMFRGETGSGKGLAARTLHQLSSRRDNAYVEINCTAIPETLMETELFGHEKGAFTDACRSRRGIFELAHSGSLFLDEIGYLKNEMQVKLLKVLEDKQFRRIGSEQLQTVDCRIITGTSVDMEKAIGEGRFRSDLYYRLNVFPIWIPPLRSLDKDILLLADHYRKIYAVEHRMDCPGFTADARTRLLDHDWPGNIRELKHSIERAVILSDGKPITGDMMDLPRTEDNELPAGTGNEINVTVPLSGKSMADIEGEIIEKMLEKLGGNRSEAARILRISRSRLLRKLKIR